MAAAPNASVCATMQSKRGCVCSPTARYLCVYLRARRPEFVPMSGSRRMGIWPEIKREAMNPMSREQPRTRYKGWDKPQPEAIYGWMKNMS